MCTLCIAYIRYNDWQVFISAVGISFSAFIIPSFSLRVFTCLILRCIGKLSTAPIKTLNAFANRHVK